MAGARTGRVKLGERLQQPVVEISKGKHSLFEEDPVPLETFLYDKRYMNQDKVLGDHQFNLVRHMEQIYLPETYKELVETYGKDWEPVRYVNYLTVQWGKGAGKDHAVIMAVCRIAYLLLCLRDPLGYYDLSQQSDIHILNVAMNAQQARRAFFKPLGQAIKSSEWFQDKLASDITDQATSIRLKKHIELISGHSEVENFEGLSPIAVVLDEISGFQSEETKASKGIVESQRTAEAVYGIVETSASTRFPENFKVTAISYPRFINDPIQNLCAKARADIEKRGLQGSVHFVDGPRSTWEVNPRFWKYKFIKIPQTQNPIPNLPSYITKYEEDASGARAKYECLPERAANRYIRNDSAIAGAFPKQNDDWVEPVAVHYYWGMDIEGMKAEKSDTPAVPGWQVAYDFGPQLQPMSGALYGIHVDLAVTNDRAGIAMCHVRDWDRREHERGSNNKNPDYQADYRPNVKVDFVTYYEADLQAQVGDGIQPREIQLRWARNLIRELRRRGFTIGLVTFDTYQSQDSIQILESWGIEADNLSMDRNIKPYANFREVLYDNRLEGYYHDLLQIEIEGLNQLPNGKIDHPPGGSKDMADALCGAVNDAITLGGDEGDDHEVVDVNANIEYDVVADLGAFDPMWAGINIFLEPEDLRF